MSRRSPQSNAEGADAGGERVGSVGVGVTRNSVDNGAVRAQVCRQGGEVWRMRFACDGGIGGERFVMLQDWVYCGDLS